MLPTDNKNGGLFTGSKDNDNRRRAAIYVRASSEHQQYSTRNQTDAIIAYADTKGFEVVKTYSDDGKSGLDIKWRKGLQQLIADVQERRADFDVVLVYDISRWGRFQDNDAGAYYEYACRQSGIDVHYVIGHLKNDGSITDSILKAVDRYSSGNYSYTLSIKVHLGSTRLIRLGYRQGGTAGFGLRRVMIDERGEPKMELKHGERKSLQTDRVILVPGPKEEIEHVRSIYRKFVDDKLTETQIAAQLNQQGVRTDLGKDWTQAAVRGVLTNEKYIGNNVYNRQSFKLKKKRVKNPPEEWVRKDNAFEAIIEPAYFLAAQHIILERCRRLTNEEMIDKLKEIYERKGWLSGIIIDEQDDLPSSAAYAHRFGGLVSAYKLVGYDPCIDYSFQEINKYLRSLFPEVSENIIKGIQAAGGRVHREVTSPLIVINDELTLSIVIARCQRTKTGALRWKLRLDTGQRPNFTIAVRMDAENKAPLDYYVLPAIDVENPQLRLAEENGFALDAYRFDSLEPFYQLAERTALPDAA